MAEYNLSKEPEIVEVWGKIKEVGEELTKLVDDKTEVLRGKGGDISLERALALLQTAASKIEETQAK